MAGRGPGPEREEPGRLLARPPSEASFAPTGPGVHALGLTPRRDGLVAVPDDYSHDRPAPLVVMLHGAGGDARGTVALIQPQAGDRGVLVLAPESRGRTWDVLAGGFGPDVEFVDRALEHVFARYSVDERRIAVGGFSDGASYALSLGMTNGDLFGHVLAFSPGFAAPGRPHGSPRVFVSHGTGDRVLRIDPTSRRLVPRLRAGGYEVVYREFDGGHTVPAEMVSEALDRFLADPR